MPRYRPCADSRRCSFSTSGPESPYRRIGACEAGGGADERLALGDGLADGGADERDALGDGDGDADFEALGDGEAEADGPAEAGVRVGDEDGAGRAALAPGAGAFASTRAASLPEELGSTHTAMAVPLRATTAAAPISSARGRREPEPVRFSGP
ncbi:hypothetical protein PV721_43350, partial [Streptomyces sp. MB09-01]|nr:hypothetical protein [Streptomyces sp. MB09-01]